jgi:hypothetical protein
MSRMAFKLKATGGKKKGNSPGSSRSGTPTNSQSSVAGNSDKQQSNEPTIDDPLINDEINSLLVTEEQLRKSHPIKEDLFKKELTSVFVKEAPSNLTQKKSSMRNVTVLHPLPQGFKPSKTKILGSFKAGPRYDSDNVFVSHSIIGTIDEYASSRAIDKQTTPSISAPSTVPPIILPETPKSHDKKQLTAPLRETNALQNWEKKIEERKQLQKKIADRIRRDVNALTMDQGDSYHRIQEERSFIDQRMPVIDRGKGFFVGSEFWRLPSILGDEETGIRTTLTKTEKGEAPNANNDIIIKPDAAIAEKDFYSIWSKSHYLNKRKDQLLSVTKPKPHYPANGSSLLIVGNNAACPPQSPALSPKADSLDSLGDNIPSDDGSSIDNDYEEASRSTSLFEGHPDICDHSGPALKINDREFHWEDQQDAIAHINTSTDDATIRVVFQAKMQELTQNKITLENCGTTVINFTWTHVKRPNPLGTSLAGKIQRFYFDTRGGIILPGERLPLVFMFKSPNVGIYSEMWQLVTRPILCSGRPIYVTLKGVAFQDDLHEQKRKEIQDKLDIAIINDAAKWMVDRIVDHIDVHIPPSPVEPLTLTNPEQQVFESLNPGIFYHYNTVQQLKAIYVEALAPPSPDGDKSKKQEDKTKKDKTAGKEKKDSTGKKPLAKEDTVDDNLTPQELNIPPWDLSLATLQKIILEIPDNDDREDKLSKLNAAISSLNLPPTPISVSTNYIKTYFILCEAVDQIVNTSDRLRHVMGLPLKEMDIQDEDSMAEMDPPSQPSSPAATGNKKETSKKTAAKAKEKEQQRPASRKGSKLPKKTSTKHVDKTKVIEHEPSKDEIPLTTKISEIDPSLNEKYRKILFSMANNIIQNSIDQMMKVL